MLTGSSVGEAERVGWWTQMYGTQVGCSGHCAAGPLASNILGLSS